MENRSGITLAARVFDGFVGLVPEQCRRTADNYEGSVALLLEFGCFDNAGAIFIAAQDNDSVSGLRLIRFDQKIARGRCDLGSE